MILSEQHEAFHEQLEERYHAGRCADGIIYKAQAKAWKRYCTLGLPTTKTEAYRYVHLRSLLSQKFAEKTIPQINAKDIDSYIYPECANSVLVFVNGDFQPSLSRTSALPKRMIISGMQEATRTYGSYLNNQWSKSIQEEVDPFAALNGALFCQGAFLYLPPKTIVEPSIQLLHLIDAENGPMLLVPRTHFFVGAHSQVSIVASQHVISGSEYCVNGLIELALEENAKAHYTQVTARHSADAWLFDAFRANLKRDSRLKTVSVTDGSSVVRNDYKVALTGENAEALLNGIWMLSDKRETHTHVFMDHQAPNCHSMQLFKGVLNDCSRSSFEGKIMVRQPAQKTEAYQLNNNLILSDKAHADSKPNLEIYADDVKASHGATVGQLDADQLFYMKARGFAESDAQNMLIRSFCQEVYDLIEIPTLRQQVL